MRRDELHLERIRRITGSIGPLASKRKIAQHERRALERDVKISALAFTRCALLRGFSLEACAHMLGIKTATLSAWRRLWDLDKLRPVPRGRPADNGDAFDRQLLIGLFNLLGPGIGLPTLRDLFPDRSRSYLEELLQRFRRVHFRKNRVALHVLRWHSPGTVWAIDFAEPPFPIDNQFPFFFVVRDLASGKVLLALPTPTKELRHVADALAMLFKQHGPPLVLKADNAFDASFVSRFNDDPQTLPRARLKALLDEHRVTLLLSPPYFPRYNGSVEAGIGSLKSRAHLEAARHGHPCEWNCDDLEAARLQANEQSKPWGFKHESPDIRWLERNTIDPQTRTHFQQSVQETLQELRQDKQQQLLPGIPLGRRDEASCIRVAISRALVKHGILSFRRGRFTLPLKQRSA